MLCIFFFVGVAAQCQECEASCFMDCSTKYKAEIMDPDEEALIQSEKAWQNKQTSMKEAYFGCMQGSSQCKVNEAMEKRALGFKFKDSKANKLSAASVRAKLQAAFQLVASRKCLRELELKKVSAKDTVSKHQEHVKKLRRHSEQLSKMSLLQEDADPFTLVKPFYVDHGAFEHGNINLAQCMDVCIASHCKCPDSDGNFMSRYPAVSASAAAAAGVPSAEETAAASAAGAAAIEGYSTTTTTTTGSSGYSYSSTSTTTTFYYSNSYYSYSYSGGYSYSYSWTSTCSGCCAYESYYYCTDSPHMLPGDDGGFEFYLGCMEAGHCM